MWPFSAIKNWIEKKAAAKVAENVKETSMWKFLEGKKTYLTMIVLIILGGIDGYNQHCLATEACKAFQIPGFLYSVLGALGIATRAVAKPK